VETIEAIFPAKNDYGPFGEATHLVQNHANLRHVQDLLDHRSLATTERYLRLTITDLKEAHAKLHPWLRQ
jgi:site-specific recombinase XerD